MKMLMNMTKFPQYSLMMTGRAAKSLNLSPISTGVVSCCALPSVARNGEGKNGSSALTSYLQREGLRAEWMPKHVTVALDGNRRWCKKYNQVRLTYVPSYNSYLMLGEVCIKLGIPALSCFIFTSYNWKRGPEFLNVICAELESILKDNIEKFSRQGIKVHIIGEKWRLPKSSQDMIKQVEEETKNGKTLDLILAVWYGGRFDIVEATKSICAKVVDGVINPEDIDEALVEQQLSNGICQVPHPDLMIRTGKQRTLGKFYLWQASHAELYFSHHLPAEFGEAQFLDALRWFHGTNRRFGK